MRWTLPNILTTARLLAAPALVLVYALLPHPHSDVLGFVLFVGAAVTDYVDGYLARKWGQVSRYGAMLDPIADKAMVIIAIAVLFALFGPTVLVMVPAAVILFREVFVSGLREFLGDTAGTLAVTKLAKWKTAVQMTAIAVLLAHGAFAHWAGMAMMGMDAELARAILLGEAEGGGWLRLTAWMADLTFWIGLALFWAAAVLTGITGWDYFAKARPHLEET